MDELEKQLVQVKNRLPNLPDKITDLDVAEVNRKSVIRRYIQQMNNLSKIILRLETGAPPMWDQLKEAIALDAKYAEDERQAIIDKADYSGLLEAACFEMIRSMQESESIDEPTAEAAKRVIGMIALSELFEEEDEGRQLNQGETNGI
jgi:hypothetical protein